MKKQRPFGNLEECYRILGISPSASLDEVKQRYRMLAKLYHPDVRGSGSSGSLSKGEATELFRKVNEAYKVIVNWKTFEAAFKRAKNSSNISRDPEDNNKNIYDEKSFSRNPFHDDIYRKKKTVSYPRDLTFSLKWRKRIATLIIGSFLVLVLAVIVIPFLDSSPKQRVVVSSPNNIITISSEPKLPEKPSSGSLPSRRTIGAAYQNHPSKSFFTVGSTEDEVLSVQGMPDKKSGQMWHYGLSKVMFRDGRVVGYDNFDGSLKVQLVPKKDVLSVNLPEYFTLGSNQDEVLLVQGTPHKVIKDTWHYGLDRIFFKEENGVKVVSGYDNLAGSLKVRVIPPEVTQESASLNRGYFTVGDSQRDVVAIQGTPQRVEQNKWFYGAFYVIFDRGKVVNVGPVPGDGGGVLKFVAKQQSLSGQSGGGNEH
ncbi:MAG: J domain-containing protein [Thermodesulforhabdaceae bacterium]